MVVSDRHTFSTSVSGNDLDPRLKSRTSPFDFLAETNSVAVKYVAVKKAISARIMPKFLFASAKVPQVNSDRLPPQMVRLK